MSVYNAEDFLKETIFSILRQTFTNFEFIIVDDCSTDSSYEIIMCFDDERIKVIKNEENIGLTKSLNKAIRLARGEYIARQDADDISLRRRFENQINYFRKYPKTALLGNSVYLLNEKGQVIGKKTVSMKPNLNILLERNEFVHGSVMINKAVINKMGGYNDLFKYSQDYELWLRISKYHTIRNLQIPLYALRIHRNSIGLLKTNEQYLYEILARKISTNVLRLDKQLVYIIKKFGIQCLYPSLNTWEKLILFEAQARTIFSGYLWQSTIGRIFLDVHQLFRSKVFFIRDHMYVRPRALSSND